MAACTGTESVCSRIAERVAEAVGHHRYDMWFERSARLAYDEGQRRLEVCVPNRFVADWIGRHFHQHLQQAAQDEVGGQVGLDVRIDPQDFLRPGQEERGARGVAGGIPGAGVGERAGGIADRRPLSHNRVLPQRLTEKQLGLGPRYRLDDFVVGPSNQLAFAAAGRLIEEEPASVGPLFIHGGVGLGKTHLLQGICRRMIDKQPQAKVHYTTAEQFTNEFLTAVRSNGLAGFRKKYRQLDLLAVDDVHFIANKAATQQEFLHSFDAIELSGARVALASDSHPKLIQQFSDALVNRCVRGMVVEIKPPDTATRVEIVRVLARRRGISLMETVVAVLAQKKLGSVREIEGMLTKLHALAQLSGMSEMGGNGKKTPAACGGLYEEGACGGTTSGGVIGHAVVQRMMESTGTGTAMQPGRAIKMQTIMAVVAEHMGMTSKQLVEPGRDRATALARALAVYLARQLTRMSFPEIAAALGRASHSTILAAYRRVQKQISENQSVVLPAALETVPMAELVDRLQEAVLKG
ncbi:MAG: ATP-binding protein [Phycisphaeraceae bacterium]|nr:ATP-binding protein [Phycisphaeraceae bacterium]